MIEPLPPDLASLIEAERAAPAAGNALREAVRAKLAISIASAPVAAAASASVVKIVTIVALAIGAGTIGVVTAKHGSKPQARSAPAIPVAHVEPLREAPPPEPPPPVVAPPATASVVAPPRHVDTIAEPDLIAAAWAALSNHEPARALELTVRDQHEHPNGVLAEECAAIAIVALARLGRVSEATAAATKFTQSYPSSVHRELVANALNGVTP